MSAEGGQSSCLQGKRLCLRPYAAGFSEAELHRLYRWSRDAELLRLTSGVPLDMSYAGFRSAFLNRLPERNCATEQLYAIVERPARLIGRAGLFAIGAQSGTAELGIAIGERECWGRGYGREAIGLLAQQAFGPLGLEELRLYVFPENARARRAFAAAGFGEAQRLRCFSLDRGSHDQIEMTLRRASTESVPAALRSNPLPD